MGATLGARIPEFVWLGLREANRTMLAADTAVKSGAISRLDC
jgi:hypothetical protein